MRTDIKREMLEYFKNKSSRTPQENRFLLYLQSEMDFFIIASASRDDVDDVGYDGQNMTDDMMDLLADKMSDSYVENVFWTDLKITLEDMGIDKLKEGETI